MKDRLASMPFFIGEYLGSMSVCLMTLAQRDACIHLLCLNWQEGRLEDDPKKLARLLDCSLPEFHRIWKGIGHTFKEDAQRRIYNPPVEAVKQQCLARRRKLTLAGRKGGKATQAKRKQGSSHPPRKINLLSAPNSIQDSSLKNHKNTPLPPLFGGTGWRANGLRASVRPRAEPIGPDSPPSSQSPDAKKASTPGWRRDGSAMSCAGPFPGPGSCADNHAHPATTSGR